MPASLSLAGTGHSSKEMLLPMAKSAMEAPECAPGGAKCLRRFLAVDKSLKGGGPDSKK